MAELTTIKGIGPKTAEALMRLGICDTEDLLAYWPRDYETFAQPTAYYQLVPGTVGTVSGVLTKAPSVNYFRGMRIVNAYLSDMTGRVQLSWYNLPYIQRTLKTGVPYVFRGHVYEKKGRLVMTQPRVYDAAEFQTQYQGKLLPVYPLTKGVTGALLRKAMTEALKGRRLQKDWLPQKMRQKYALCDINFAVPNLHFPESTEALSLARRRMSFDEFLLFLLGVGQLKAARGETQSAFRLKPDLRLIQFIADLPFELTKAQQKAFREISADLCSGRVMNRMLEGDVGSGKTIVAFLAMLFAALNGYQAVLMAPTEVLCAQHLSTIRSFLKESPLSVSCVLLTGSMTAAEKKNAYARIASHEVDLIVGTHAVFQEKVQYADLALVVTDEQHRFGVGQRGRIAQKGQHPHVLVMSATPIPRSLAMILYGDLDLSVLDTRPSGRKAIKNCVIGADRRQTAWKFLLDEMRKDHQAYVICPMIEADTDAEEDDGGGNAPVETLAGTGMLENVTAYAEKLKKALPPDCRIGILHGRMNSQEKEDVMRAFQSGAIRVLVSTTVVEVGVDVPNATVMLIENAERFGLAQLHQLRGRVGRGEAQSYCVLINTSDSETAARRLEILNRSNDGFFIANEDLKLRGPGDLMGVRQSGDLQFRFADIYRDSALLKDVKDESETILREDPSLSMETHRLLAERLALYEKRGFRVL